MGKDKQRTKGGLKPSSSGRTAELLFKSQNVGFETPSGFSAFGPLITFGTADFDGQDSSLTPEVRLVLKKLGKKDATTKIKALGELSELFSETPSLCQDVLQYWPRIYYRLATDDSRKVRELCHGLLETIGKHVGRNLAPHLKTIFPYWLLSQNDIFPPASSTASNAFRAIFTTDKKQTDTIIFCREEILSLIAESLKIASAPQKKSGTSKQPVESDEVLDSENYELRMIYSSLVTLTKLVESAVVEEEHVQPFLDSDSLWTLTKHASSPVRRQLFNLITTIANWKPSLIQRQCIKAITQSLKEETSECLQSLWNCFLTLTLNCEVFTTDPNLTKSQLLKVCKKGFYGNARSLGPAILPLVAKIGVDERLVRDLLPALQEGYTREKSTLEKSAILRAYVEILAYYVSTTEADLSSLLEEVALPFIDVLIANGTAREFAKTVGALIKKEQFYSLLGDWLAKDPSKTSDKNYGYFIVALCSNEAAETDKCLKKSVKFLTEDAPSKEGISYDSLPPFKKAVVVNLTKCSLTTSGLETIAVLSNNFQCESFYNDISDSIPACIVDSNALQSSGDKDAKLSLVLDLIKTFPSLPSFLGKLSSLFESEFNTLQELRRFITRISSFVSLSSVSRWLKQDLFCSRINLLVIDSDSATVNDDTLAIIKFILKNSSVFGNQLVEDLAGAIGGNLKTVVLPTDPILDDVLRLIRSMPMEETLTVDVNRILFVLWERLVHFSVNLSMDQESKDHLDYLIEQLLGLTTKFKISPVDLYPTVLRTLETVENIKEIDVLVKLTKTFSEGDSEISNYGNYSRSNLSFEKVKTEDLLNFTGLSYSTTVASTPALPIYENIQALLKPSFLSRMIFEAKFALEQAPEEILDFVSPVLKIFYAQAVCTFWKELERFEMIKVMPEELLSELTVLCTRWLEIMAENKWNRWREDLLTELLKPNRDVVFSSKLPLQLFLKTVKKMELAISFVGRSKNLNDFILEDSVSLENEQALPFLEALLQNYFMEDRVHDIIPVIDYLSLQRKNFADNFQFERIYAHLSERNKQILLALIEVVIKILEKIEMQDKEDAEDFYTAATCWVSAWLKQCKKLPTAIDKFYLLWVSKLSAAVTLIAQHARDTPKFTAEYMEFHAANLYLPLYHMFLQLGRIQSNDFLMNRTAELMSIALSSVPSPTLAFIEPSSSTICEKFTPYLESSRLPVKVLAYRLLKKVKPNSTGGEPESKQDSIVPVEIQEIIRKYGEELASRELETLVDDHILTYLLTWDALLTMHADRNCNEFGSFSKEAHLLPQLLSIIFFQLIDLIPEQRFPAYFENNLSVQVVSAPTNLGHIVCSVLLKTLQCLPYPTRWWWNSQLSKQRDKLFVEKFIMKFLSSRLAAEELKRVQWDDSDSVTVHPHPGCNELIAHYKIEDTTVSLTATLPLNHPLGPISVKISDKKLLGKISNLLNNRSNSLAAGLQLWKENLDAKYSGHEECAICFFILHGPTKSLPKLACKTCSHKFHSACLLKWFNTSNKSECPLCRNLF